MSAMTDEDYGRLVRDLRGTQWHAAPLKDTEVMDRAADAIEELVARLQADAGLMAEGQAAILELAALKAGGWSSGAHATEYRIVEGGAGWVEMPWVHDGSVRDGAYRLSFDPGVPMSMECSDRIIVVDREGVRWTSEDNGKTWAKVPEEE